MSSSVCGRYQDVAEFIDVLSAAAILNMDMALSDALPTKEDDDASIASTSTKDRPRSPSRNFSDFTLTAHLQVPLIRLVYLPFRLEITLTHVPEIPENFKLVWYTGGNTTAAQVIDAVLDELGIRKIVTQGSKSARVVYSISANNEGAKFSNKRDEYYRDTNDSSPSD